MTVNQLMTNKKLLFYFCMPYSTLLLHTVKLRDSNNLTVKV